MPVGIQDPVRALLVTADEVRSFTGWKTERDVEEGDIEFAIRAAQSTLIGSLTRHVRELRLSGDIDGDNTLFHIPSTSAARVIFDEDLTPGTVSSDALVQGVVKPASGDPTYTTLNISAIDALNGILTLDAAPEDYDYVVFTGRLTTRRLDREALRTAILCKTALLLDARVREAGKLNLANPDAQKKQGNASSGRRAIWEDVFEEAMKSLRHTVPRKAGIRTAMPIVDDTIETNP